MDDNLIRLLHLNIEIEGLIRVLISHDSDEAKSLLQDKWQEYSLLMKSFGCVHAPISDASTGPLPAEAPEQVTEPLPAEAPEQVTEPLPIEEQEEFTESLLVEGPEQITEPLSAEEPEQTTEPLPIEEPQELTEPLPVEVQEQPVDEPKHNIIPDVKVQLLEDDEDATVHTPLPESISHSPARLADVIAIKGAKSLIGAFTLNDKYRFIRGIFCDDKADFEDTVEDLSRCQSLGEVYDYLLNERGWDPDNEEVKEFMSIAANYFNNL